ncbi:hypothetical protein RND71_002232 [Anisodus tanguticus]|uniref:Transcription repressor n=1 Tax=Anisodus tanguticus TaxID=243964 RepID=A0AAE1T1J4_9SOLA|nr:hypothetical protein RND71_002232 [Anisodus tanguticus]
MSSKIKKWKFGKLFTSNGAGCSGCSKPNLADIIETKPKIPIHTKPSSTSICHTSSSSREFSGVHFMDDDFDQDVHTSTTFSIDIGPLSPQSSNQNDNINLLQSEANLESKVISSYPNNGGNLDVVKNLDGPFQDNHSSTPFSINNIGSLSPPGFDQNDDTNLSQSETNSGSKVSTCPEISGTLAVVKNLDDPFQDHHTPTPFINIGSLSPPNFDQTDDTNLSLSESNSGYKVGSCLEIGGTLNVVNNLNDPSFQDNHTSTTFSINTESLSPPSSNQNEQCTNLLRSEANSEFRVDSCTKISSSTLAAVINSDDPFQDFKKSMLQMIFEKEIYSPEDLEELLNCFLHLNSPSHHYIIIQAFMEILNSGKVVSE